VFAGIIKSIGKITSNESSRLFIASDYFLENPIKKGASIAIDGVCLTACYFPDKKTLGFDLGLETKKLTLLSQKEPGSFVNLEYSLCLGDPIDGHLVQGHVDAQAEILNIYNSQESKIFTLSLPSQIKTLITHKGSIAINGVSLTVNNIKEDSFSVCLVPFTMENTTFSHSQVGQLVHIETDIIGRYLARHKEYPWTQQ
jgi:riboflavin synthase